MPKEIQRKQAALNHISRVEGIHNKDDLSLIMRTLQSEKTFKILCGCMGLERFLAEEVRKEAFKSYFERGAVRQDLFKNIEKLDPRAVSAAQKLFI